MIASVRAASKLRIAALRLDKARNSYRSSAALGRALLVLGGIAVTGDAAGSPKMQAQSSANPRFEAREDSWGLPEAEGTRRLLSSPRDELAAALARFYARSIPPHVCWVSDVRRCDNRSANSGGRKAMMIALVLELCGGVCALSTIVFLALALVSKSMPALERDETTPAPKGYAAAFGVL